MGHSHCYKNGRAFTPHEWARLTALTRAAFLAAEPEIVLCGGGGEDEPVADGESIWFNGAEAAGQSCETMFIEPTPEPGKIIFCKTNHLPYDFVVQVVMVLAQHVNPAFRVASDADAHEWKPAVVHAHLLLGEKVKFALVQKSEL